MSPHPGNPPDVKLGLGGVVVPVAVVILLVLAAWALHGCARITCPTCSPIVVCEPWINPMGDGGASGSDAGSDASPVPSGSSTP